MWDIYSYARNKGVELSGIVEGECQKKFRLEDVYYFEALDEKVCSIESAAGQYQSCLEWTFFAHMKNG